VRDGTPGGRRGTSRLNEGIGTAGAARATRRRTTCIVEKRATKETGGRQRDAIESALHEPVTTGSAAPTSGYRCR
jgi:hypothetical protein